MYDVTDMRNLEGSVVLKMFSAEMEDFEFAVERIYISV